MSTIALHIQKIIHRQERVLHAVSVSWNAMFAIGMGMAMLLSICYVLQVNQLTKSYYFISQGEQQIKSLSQEHRSLAIVVAQNSYLDYMVARAHDMDFQAAHAVKYIQVTDNSFAMAK